MSRFVGTMEQPASGLATRVYDGWSWPAFFFGPLWYMAKGMWGRGLVFAVLALITAGIAWLAVMLIGAAVGNRQYREHLAKQGYSLVGAEPGAAAKALERKEVREHQQDRGLAVIGGIAVGAFGVWDMTSAVPGPAWPWCLAAGTGMIAWAYVSDRRDPDA